VTRRIGITLLVLALLLLECGYHVPPEPTRRAQCDQLDEVVGQVELVASAERGEGGGWLSPGGTRLLFGIKGESYILDVATGRKEKVDADVECVSATEWLTDDLLLVYCAIDQYYVVDIHNLDRVTTTDLSLLGLYEEETELQMMETLLSQADQVYELEAGISYAARHVIALGGDTSHILLLELPGRDAAVDDLLARIPHQVVPQQGIWHGERLPSPDGLFYAAYFSGDDPGSNVGIFTQSGDLVAHAHKHNWGLCILGWAYDSSGLFFSAQQGTVDGDVLYPWAPVFKLLAPTPSPGE